ncbi:NAD(P)-dependent oxidoreductase [cyanobiont of Ornithocercus magnificus]|nr:NAD(P)-dependent oxidoreductase [cyanobiont of Ornithocercus magnificus]
MPTKILITGASGCVGQYICRWFIDHSDVELLLWLRDPKKLSAVSANHPRIQLLIGDLRDSERFKDILWQVDRVIHTATAWGDPERAEQVNVVAVEKLFAQLDKNRIEQIIYFSTASILDKDLRLLPKALTYGTEYIKTKAYCLQQLESHSLAPSIVAVFPTLVFGGRVDGRGNFPSSYLTAGLEKASRWLWLARFLRADASFHFIHAADIADICGRLATSAHKFNCEQGRGTLQRIVMGQAAVSVDEAVNILCRWRGVRRLPGLPLRGWLIEVLIRILPIQINDWDRFTIRQRHFTYYPVTTPESLGGHSHAATLESALEHAGLLSG